MTKTLKTKGALPILRHLWLGKTSTPKVSLSTAWIAVATFQGPKSGFFPL
jgi:hypothetical protein